MDEKTILNLANSLNPSLRPIKDMDNFAENLGFKIHYKRFTGDLSGVAALLHYPLKNIYVNDSDSYKEQRFSIAHEIGHYYMHMKDMKDEDCIISHRKSDEETISEREIEREKEADLFACYLLAPKNTVNIFKSLGYSPLQLSDKFGVSKEKILSVLD